MQALDTLQYASNEVPLLRAKVYAGRFLSAGLKSYDEVGDVINISPENLMKIAMTHQGVPVVINHVELTKQNIANEKVGYVSKVFLNDEGFSTPDGKKYPADNWAWCYFTVEKQEAVDLIDKHNWELSNSYIPIEVNSNSPDYDVDVVGGKGLHLAIVPEGRYDTRVARLNAKTDKNNNFNLSNTTMNMINNAKKILLGKTIKNSEKSHEDKKEAEMIAIQKEEAEKMNNSYKGKKFRDNEGNEYDAEEVMNAVKEHHEQAFPENILDMDGEYDINGNPWTGHHLIEYFKNIKNEAMEMEKHGVDNNESETEELEEMEEEEEAQMRTLEEMIEKEKKNRNNVNLPKSSGYFNIRKAKESFLRNNAENSVKSVVVETSPNEKLKSIFSPIQNNH